MAGGGGGCLSKARKEALIEQDDMIEQIIARAVKASHRRAKRSVILGSSSDDGAVEPLTLREARRLALARAGLLKPEWTGLPVVDKGYETNRRDKCQLDTHVAVDNAALI